MKRPLILVGLALALTTACKSKLTGNEGNLTFSYVADDDLLDFNKPIAVGAYLDLTVTEAGTDATVTVDEATSDDTGVLDVIGMAGTELTLMGTGDGTALVEVLVTLDDGSQVTDSVNMTAAVPDVHLLSHSCGADGATAYLTGQSVYVPFEFERDNGQSVIGYGYYPVTLSDSAAFVLDADWEGTQYMHFTTVSAGAFTMTSDLDDTTLDVTLVDAGDLDGVAEPLAFVLEDIDVGDTNSFYVLPMVGERTVCQADTTFAVESLTPDICSVALSDQTPFSSGSAAYEYGWFKITGEAQGTCQYTVTYEDSGAVGTFEYPIEP